MSFNLPITALCPVKNPAHPEPSGGASGQASDIAIHAKEILRIRKLLTGVYERHCGQLGESQEQGLHRFGTSVRCLSGMAALLRYFAFLLFVPTETALERDYFMTGSSLLPWLSSRSTELPL